MTARIVPVDPFDIVVFGGTGDLAYRKLFPALFRRDADRQLTDPTRIIGVARRDGDTESYRKTIRDSLMQHVGEEANDEVALNRFLARVEYHTVDASGDAGWAQLAASLGSAPGRIRAFYLAVAPDLFGGIAQRLAQHGLIDDLSRIIVEKPIGKDGASAAAINDAIGQVFAEKQIFRIDHYLGKETVQNLMALRFANALFEPLWNSAHIDHVQITVAETLGVEGRGGYYDGSGALRDMVQNHILQLVCLTAMEPPSAFSADAVRDEKLKVLKALRPIEDGKTGQFTVRGQYRSGAVDGKVAPNYLEEIGKPSSLTETFVAIKAEVESWRFAGVPFYLRTGKRLGARLSEIVVVFKRVPHSIFEAGAGIIAQNRLVIRLQPDEGIKLWLMLKEPGPGGLRFQHVPLDMSFDKAFSGRVPEAYERLLMDVIRGNATLFMRRDEVQAAWNWIDPIRAGWAEASEGPKPYASGSWGPTASVALIERDGRTWNEDLG